jgi:trehalose 6-phosphate phosphatase
MNAKLVAAPHLFDHWKDLAARVHASHKIVLFLDFDGTLVPIAPKPELVRLKAATRRALLQLAKLPSLTLVLISGRRRGDLRNLLKIPQLTYLGLYGWENNGSLPFSMAEQISLIRARLLLNEKFPHASGVWVEPKQASLSVHLLGCKPAGQRRARALVRRSLYAFRNTLHLFENLRDIEVLPRSIRDKGAAVRRFLAKPSERHALPIFLGDDLSDETAFAAVHRGVSVLVGKPRPTCAQFRLRDPGEVTAALARLGKELL